jgi:hypothetical protein
MTSIIKVDNLQNQCGANIISESSNVITIGASGDTVTLAAGASQSGFGRSGSVNWDTTPKTTTPVTGVSGNGYFINTTSIAITVNLPATPAAGDIVAIADYANTSATNNITVGRNGSLIDGFAVDGTIKINGQVYTLVYVDATEGWKTVGQTFNQITTAEFVAATGGTITTSGDFKIHTFTSPGTFSVTNAGSPVGSNSVDYLVVAAGGGGGRDDFGTAPDPRNSGGGGAGGFRISNSYGLPAPTTSPLASPTGIPVTATDYPITIGAGGAGGTGPCGSDGSTQPGAKGNNAIFSTITSAGGGGGLGHSPGPPAGGPCASQVAKLNGGSGGGVGGGYSNPVGAIGTGNNPPTSPPQGNNGGLTTNPSYGGAGGGGAGAVGSNAPAGNGGIGSFASPSFAVACAGTPGPAPGVRYFAGGGAGSSGPGASGTGGAGGGGSNADGTANTGGGGGGRRQTNANAGGSGIIIIRYKFQ